MTSFDAQWRAARMAWPTIDVPLAAFIQYMAERTPDWNPPAPVEGRAVNDLYLAAACASGDVMAIRAFEDAYRSEMKMALRKGGAKAQLRDDILQAVRTKLFVASPGERPKIAEYTGTGELRHWVRIVVVRNSINVMTRQPREAPAEEEVFATLLDGDDDPELACVKRRYKHEFERSIADAFRSLEPQEQKLLRATCVDGLGIDAIAPLFDVHRATVARWLVQAHGHWIRAIRRCLKERLMLSDRDYESMVALVQSRISVRLPPLV